MNLQANDFELFGLPVRFAQEAGVVDARWKDLQRQAHPDRFSDQGAAAQRVAMQWSARINEAAQRLKEPLRRAAYLCELRGAPIQAESNTAMPAEFLMEQMAWREALDEADSEDDFDRLEATLRAARTAALSRIERLLDVDDQPARAAQEVRALMFVERFARDVEARLDRLGH